MYVPGMWVDCDRVIKLMCVCVYVYIMYVNKLLDVEQVAILGKGETVVDKVRARVMSHGVVCKELSSLEEVWWYEVLHLCSVG